MRAYPFTITVLILGAILALWSALPWESGQDAFYGFIFFYGPSIVFSVALVTFAIITRHAWPSLLLLLFGPIIYLGGGHILSQWEDTVVGSSLIASLVTAYVFLAATRLLVFRRCPWSVVFGWGALAALAGIPFVYPIFKFGSDWLGGFWFWGLHILLWYLAVGHAIDKMAMYPTPKLVAE